MANIKITVEEKIYDGMPISFRAPCNCDEVEGLEITYRDSWWEEAEQWWYETKTFLFADAHGNVLTGINNLFAKDAVVKVVLDTDTNKAFVQNADTNAYLEGRLNGADNAAQQAYMASQDALAKASELEADIAYTRAVAERADVYSGGVLTERVGALEADVGNIDAALDELHAYAQALINGGGA